MQFPQEENTPETDAPSHGGDVTDKEQEEAEPWATSASKKKVPQKQAETSKKPVSKVDQVRMGLMQPAIPKQPKFKTPTTAKQMADQQANEEVLEKQKKPRRKQKWPGQWQLGGVKIGN